MVAIAYSPNESRVWIERLRVWVRSILQIVERVRIARRFVVVLSRRKLPVQPLVRLEIWIHLIWLHWGFRVDVLVVSMLHLSVVDGEGTLGGDRGLLLRL
jgi:hypothetical protein